MSEFQIPEPNMIQKPTADIILTPDENGVVQHESFAVIPRNARNDFMRPMKMSDINKIKSEAYKLKGNQFDWDELGIGIASLGFGATLSAIASKLPLNDALGIAFYIVSPIISFSSLVFIIMYKLLKKQKASSCADMICNIIGEYIDNESEENVDES